MHVLILDSDARAAFAIGLMLKTSSLSADRAASAEEALELDSRHRYDILLLDLAEAALSEQQLRRMRAIRLTRPMLVLSRSDRPEMRRAALLAGADGYLLKPFGRGELLARIRGLLVPVRQRSPSGMVERGLVPVASYAALPAAKPSGRMDAPLRTATGSELAAAVPA